MTVSVADPDLGQEERDNILRVLDSGYLADGDVVREFEAAFGEVTESDHAVGTANGTTALHAALEAVGVSSGSNVLTTPFSFVATGNAIRFAGGTPLFADIDPETFNLDPDDAGRVIREHDGDIDAIVVVHLYGLPADMDRFVDLAETYDLALVEDAAQAHGATYHDTPVGSIGDVGCFSFYPTKNMTTGEGGMVTTDRDDVARAVRQFIDHGRNGSTYEHATLGHNFRMTNLAAAIGRAQLEKLPTFVERRRENAAYLTSRLGDTGVTAPVEPEDRRHAYHQYTIRCDDRDQVRFALERNDIDSAVYYPTCIHHLESFAEFDASTPAAEAATEAVLSLPIHPGVTTDDLDVMTETIADVTGGDGP